MPQEPEKKKGLFSRLSEALFEEVETAPESVGQPAAVPSEASPSKGEASGVDEKLHHDLLKQLADEGPLLGQFLELAATLADIVPQESASYQAALKALEKTTGAGKKDILAAVDAQLQALGREKSAFVASVEKKLAAQQVAGRKSEEIRTRIGELQKAIQALEQEEQQLFAKMANEEKLIRTAQLRFDSTVREVERGLRGTLEKIRSYLPDPPGRKDA